MILNTYKYKLSKVSESEFVLTIDEINYLVGKLIYIILDGNLKNKSLNEIIFDIKKIDDSNITESEVNEIIEESIKPLFKKNNFQKKKNPVKSLFVIFEPKRFIQYYQIINRVFSKNIFWFTFSILTIYSILFFLINQRIIVESSSLGLNWIYAFLFTIFVIFIHEMGHVVSASRYGVTAKSVGFGFYFIYPAFYTDLTEIWRLNKEERIIINLAGIYFQLILNVILSVLILTTNYSELFTTFLISNSLILFFNLNPLFKFDGYWVYSDYFELHNLRESSNKLLLSFFNKKSGIKNTQRIKKSLFIYSILYLLFMGIMWFVIFRYFYLTGLELINEISNNQISYFYKYNSIKKIIFFGITVYLVINIIITSINLKKYLK
jgi:putative peptide zinc metalloprotease protein